jgi:glutamate-ammonia-ligase adenylyltransferase
VQKAVEEELRGLLDLLADGLAQEARERLNRKLVESLQAAQGELAQAMQPVEIEFDNRDEGPWTLMRVKGKDTPAFLYMLANALVMRGIYVHGVRIEGGAGFVRDEFAIAHRDGGKIVGENDQHVLRLAVALIKQFSHFLTSAPDPARALRSFDQLLDRVMVGGAASEALNLLRGEEGLRSLARLLGSSEFLWDDFLRRDFDHLLPVLSDWRQRPLRTREEHGEELRRRLEASEDADACRRRINQWKDEEMLAIDVKRLLDPEVSITRFSEALAELAEAFVEGAVRVCSARLTEAHGDPRLPDGRPCAFAVLGLGKFGGRELGYASDLELLFAYEGAGATTKDGLENGLFFERLVQELMELVQAPEEGMFHLDLRLRPHGKKGPLAAPVAMLQDYYRTGGDAHPLERQALIKMRPVAGDPELGRRVIAIRDAFVWSGEPWDHAEALRLRERQVTELVPAGRFNVKLSRGGLVDVEYAAQYLQIQQGCQHAVLRTPSTLEALAALAGLGFLSPQEHGSLRDGYLFWRRVADGLRMVRGQASDLLLPDEGSQELRVLARRLGYGGKDWAEAAGALDADIDRHRLAVRSFFDRRFATV